MDLKIPFFGKDRYFKTYEDDILSITKKVYSHGNVIMGPEVEKFEKEIAQYCQRKYAITVGSCTDALYFSLLNSNIKKGDEILVTGFSFLASASCIIRIGAIPVFVDIEPDTYMMNLKDLENKITPKTKAIIAVNLFGDALNINSIEEIGKKHNLIIIEDAAQSIGSSYKERKVGSLGLCSCISFDPTKTLAAQSNGGAILTDDKPTYENLSKIRYHGKNLKTGEFELLGFNSRLTSLQAAILSYNLNKLEDWIKRIREIAKMYIEGLKNIKGLTLPKERTESRHVYHKFIIRTKERDKLRKWLNDNNIQTKIHYEKALHENLLFQKYEYQSKNLNEIEQIKTQILSLPIHPWLSNKEVNYIIEKIRAYFLDPKISE